MDQSGNTPRFSISAIVPVYNREGVIGGCLESILAQTHPVDEVIVVDDGSTDGTADVVSGFARRDPRVRLVKQANAGPSQARNTGLREAASTWTALLDSDDKWAPEKVSHLYALTEADPTIDFVHTNRAYFSTSGELLRGHERTASKAQLEDKAFLLSALNTHSSTVCIRRDLLDRLPVWFDPNFTMTEDYEFFWRCIVSAQKVAYVESNDSWLFVSPDGYSRHISDYERSKHVIRAIDAVLAWLDARGESQEYRAGLSRMAYWHYRSKFNASIAERSVTHFLATMREATTTLPLGMAAKAMLGSFLGK